MLTMATHRPRNIDTIRASAILYGDLGTSKAYVIGLAFALAGYGSFWLILAVSLLTILIGVNYTIICRYYPNGGGVYASVRRRSQIISMIGAFFLIADYLVTAALSALSAFSYFGVSDPILFSAIFIAIIGILNYFGPRHTGSIAFVIGILAVFSLSILAIFCIPHLPEAWKNIQPLKGKFSTIWTHFVGVIVALSGIEAIANVTGIMKLNPGSTDEKPVVTKTSTRAIVAVITEVAVLTSLFAFAAAAIPTFEVSEGTVNAPGNPNVRDYMLRYIAEVFAGNFFGPTVGYWFGTILSIFIGVLLLSAVNTAINGLVALQYLMASDGEVPHQFQKINQFGVPLIPLIVATIIPIILVIAVRDVAGLAALYAIGFVGAIATNLGSTSTDFRLALKKKERLFMFVTFLFMAAIEITLFIDKPAARMYGIAVIAAGLLLRGVAKELGEKRAAKLKAISPKPIQKVPEPLEKNVFSILCITKRPGKALKSALEKSSHYNYPLYLLFIREQEVISDGDMNKTWEEDDEAVKIYSTAQKKGKEELIHFYYSVSDSPPDIIIAFAERLEVKQIILDTQGGATRMLKGDIVSYLRRHLPDDVIISPMEPD